MTLQPPSNSLGEAAQLIAHRLRRPPLSPFAIGLVAGSVDFIAITLAAWFARYAAEPLLPSGLSGVAWSIATGLLAVAILGASSAYRIAALRRLALGAAFAAGAGVILTIVFAALGLWNGAPLRIAVLSLVFMPLAVLPGRAFVSVLARWAMDYGLVERRAILFGGGDGAANLIRGLNENPNNDIRVCGIFDDRTDARSPSSVIGIPKIGNIEDLIAFSRAAEIDMLIVTLPLEAEARIQEVLERVKVLPLDVRLSAFSNNHAFPRRGGLIELARRPLLDADCWMKRAFDVVSASAALIILSPVLVLTALVVRLDSPGPVIFRQPRHGYNHRPIEVLKFRSMYHEDCDALARDVVTRGDPRVTRVGRFIRKYSIDELPQLFNVLRGELSMVGPRPHAVNAVSSRKDPFERIVDGYAARHRVPPGITGWAQIHGWRGEIDDPESLKQRVEHDLYYIENRSLLLDLKVLLMTPFSLLDTRSSY